MRDLSQLKVPEQQRPDNLDDDVRLRWVPDFEGSYAVTDDGRIFSYRNHNAGKFGDPYEKSQNKGRCYPTVSLCVDQNRQTKCVHRLVLLAFRGEPKQGQECRHLNGDPQDNRLTNLKWGTPSKNAQDKKRHGTMPVGENSHASKLTEPEVKEIRDIYENDEATQVELANMFSADQTTISQIVRRETWQHI